ncbi:MAG: malate synthase A [Gemmatimonadetes bacterium]|nr:malate synthase A [Gemmatimonadota bacterium]
MSQQTTLVEGVRIVGARVDGAERVLTPGALEFVALLQRRFDARRRELLRAREARQAALDAGARPGFLEETREIREAAWRVAEAPPDLRDRRVEITGPAERKMIINALNSGAKVFMADFEDALSPTWANVVQGQANLQDAVRRTIALSAGGKEYRLAERTATLVVRPRGWHLPERHVEVDGEPVSASLFDFGLYFYHNARELLSRGTGPYFYLPKLESHLEARLWNDVFVAAQDVLGVPRGSIRATVLIETILAAFEMEEILWELREHSAGLNAGRWDYIFSVIKKFHAHREFLLPDRAQVTMTVPFMRAYAELLARTCHRRGAHAIGGMAAFIPNRRDPEVTERALAKVREDKEREAGQGFDGTWVAHPDLVPVAREVFDRRLGERPNQLEAGREPAPADAAALLDVAIPGASVTLQGVLTNVDVALQYLAAWLGGTGAVAIYNLMEDAATAEISRAQLWQWLRLGATTAEGEAVTEAMYRSIRDQALSRLLAQPGADEQRLGRAAALLDDLVLSADFIPFLTLIGYPLLD